MNRLWRAKAQLTDELTDAEWQELADLIVESPPARIHAAVRVIHGSAGSDSETMTPHLPSVVEWLLYLDDISSGVAFDRALLGELRRLSIH